MSYSLLERSPIRWCTWMTESSSNGADRRTYSSTQKPTGLVSSLPDSSATAKRNSGRALSHSSESERAECSLSHRAKFHVLVEKLKLAYSPCHNEEVFAPSMRLTTTKLGRSWRAPEPACSPDERAREITKGVTGFSPALASDTVAPVMGDREIATRTGKTITRSRCEARCCLGRLTSQYWQLARTAAIGVEGPT